MLIRLMEPPVVTAVNGPVSPLNAVWLGSPRHHLTLPQLGHLLLVFPLGETAVACSGITINTNQYLTMTPPLHPQPVALDMIDQDNSQICLLVLWLSPAFIVDMARFLNIPDNLGQLLHGVPLLQGDQMSGVLFDLANACQSLARIEIIEDYFLEAVGEIMRLMRLRHQALQSLAEFKRNTTDDLLPLLLQARQFVEARYTESIKTKDVADYVALSEFHFARLFRTAFDITLHQYVIRLRLDEARRLLEQPAATVTDTAYAIGYNSLSSFIHAFTRQFDISPARYQAQIKTAQDLTSPQPNDPL